MCLSVWLLLLDESRRGPQADLVVEWDQIRPGEVYIYIHYICLPASSAFWSSSDAKLLMGMSTCPGYLFWIRHNPASYQWFSRISWIELDWSNLEASGIQGLSEDPERPWISASRVNYCNGQTIHKLPIVHTPCPQPQEESIRIRTSEWVTCVVQTGSRILYQKFQVLSRCLDVLISCVLLFCWDPLALVQLKHPNRYISCVLLASLPSLCFSIVSCTLCDG